MVPKVAVIFFIGLILCHRPNAHHHGPWSPPYERRRCAFGNNCWPDHATWTAFNDSISGRLVRSFPSAARCHEAQYDEQLCQIVRDNWDNSFWRTNQTGAYSAILWELGNDRCFINSSVSAPCGQGLVPYYSVAAQEVSDIQAAVRFANYKDLYLVVKNTGHSHLGRSSGKNALSIWTHNLKGKQWHDSFVPVGAPRDTQGQGAVTLQAGEQWLDVYEAAAEQGVIVVGGNARTVGTSGGYVTGGGHSAWANKYGLATDNLLEVTIVTATGDHEILNTFTDPGYFYAVRGGGGSAWGVIISVTYKTHPNPSHLQLGLVQFNATGSSAVRTVQSAVMKSLVDITSAGYTGYGVFDQGFSGIFIQPNGTNETFVEAFAPFYQLSTYPNVSAVIGNFTLPSWIDYCDAFLTDPNIGTNIQDASRLLTADILLNKTDDLIDMISDFPDAPSGFNFIGKVNPTNRANTAVNSVWDFSHALLSFGIDWADDEPAHVKTERKQRLVEISRRFDAVIGPDGGTYINEANPYEPEWQRVFWGDKYETLLKIKHRVDPTNLFVCNRCVGTDIIFEP
ncbi:putative FAD binding domain protein [Lineolata rhizophorae]|uniref:Putative FAD binding domain protein n=1 Tax=Lineolata rhizophorae TaxID=578093 RepID=A0A6A6P3E8_9PEZI|nr:putative FAD binding domain protein [Lineolata rhizophorae]